MDRDRYDQLVQEFLKKKRIAIWGVEDAKGDPGQMVARKFRKQGVGVIAVNPRFSDDASQQRASSLTRIDPPVEAVLVYVDRPQTMEAVEDCIAAKIPLVWLHDALSPGAAIPAAIDKLRSAGCSVIPGLCPVFYLRPVDPAHFCLRWILRLAGKERRTRHRTRVAALAAASLLACNPNQPELLAAEKAKAGENVPQMVRVEKGSFQMGDPFGDPKYSKALAEVPVHEVELDSFEIGKYEVTVGEFRAFIKETGYLTSAERPSGRPFPGNWQQMPYRQADNEPVLDISWDDAIRYCNWLSRTRGLPPAFDETTGALLDEKENVTTDVRNVAGYRLPTEAEWEFAARERGKKVRFGNGQDIARSEEINFDASVENASLPMEGHTNRARSTPVDSFKPNALGLYNMSGNAWEWCLDRAEDYKPTKEKNPFTPGGQPKIIRGGGLTCDVTIIRNTSRFCFGSGQSCPASGIRLARSVK